MENLELPPISEEQLETVNLLKDKNVIVDSVAGSGKTTTVLYIAKTYPKRDILLLTYNKKLKMETREKVKNHNIKNLETHSYHSFCVKYYKRDCYTDYGIIDIVKKNAMIIKPFSYSMIILDEAQDICPLYYQLIVKIYKDNEFSYEKGNFSDEKESNICILGDQYQSIYDFNNADPRFIVFGNQLFNFNSLEFANVHLHTSFRITQNMADFVNYCMLGYNWNSSNSYRVKSFNKKRSIQNRTRYIICDTFGYIGKDSFSNSPSKGYVKSTNQRRTYAEIEYYLSKGYSYDEIFVLAPSVKSSRSPVRMLANKLSDKGVPVYVPVSDEEVLDEDILKNKLVFSTYHQSKGLERKVIIVFSFDDSYFKYYKKENNPNECPNELYVACTRGKEQLTVFHHYQNGYLPFLNKIGLRKFCYFEDDVGISKKRKDNGKQDTPQITTEVTDLIRHLPVSVIKEALSYLDIETVNNKGTKIDIAVKTKQKDLYEGVSEITGVAIPSYFELMKTGKMSIFRDDIEYIMGQKSENGRDDVNTSFDNYMFINDAKNEDTVQMGGYMFVDDFSEDINTKMDEDINEQMDGYMFIDEGGNTQETEYQGTSIDVDNQIVDQLEEGPILLQKKDIIIDKLTCKQLLFIANIWNSYKTGYKYKINQIHDYNWLTKDKLIKCVQRLNKHISEKSVFEQKVELGNEDELLGRKLVGYIDCIDIVDIKDVKYIGDIGDTIHENSNQTNYNIWEIKSVQKLENEHILQLAIYMYLFEKNKLRKAERIKNRLECKIKAIKDDDQSMFLIDNEFVIEVGDIVEFIYLGKVYKGLVLNISDNNYFNIIVDGGNTFNLTTDDIICNKTDKSTKTKPLTQNPVPKLNDEALYKIKKWENEMVRINDTLNQKYNYYLYNILDDHKIRIDADIKSLEKLVEFLIYNKFFNSKKKTDAEFIDYIQSLNTL